MRMGVVSKKFDGAERFSLSSASGTKYGLVDRRRAGWQ